MISGILNALITTVAADQAGRMVKKRVSATKAGVNIGGLAALYGLLPLALNGDEQAIGALLVMVVGSVEG